MRARAVAPPRRRAAPPPPPPPDLQARRSLPRSRSPALSLTRASPSTFSKSQDEVTIRRQPPNGLDTQRCGPVDFQIPELEDPAAAAAGAPASAPDNAPRNILEEIVWHKAVEVARWRAKVPLAALASAAKAAPPARDFVGALRAAAAATGRPGLIAEVKKASPSKGVIQPDFDPVRIGAAYAAGGAACLSVLTDAKFFQGAFENLSLIRGAGVPLPLLAKEFVVEAYQIFKARGAGADAVLLIAAVLPNSDMDYLVKAARSVGMQCLIEVHSEAELARVLRLPGGLAGCMLGINNRNLEDFSVDLALTERIMASAPGRAAAAAGMLVAGESGIFTPADVARVAGAGCGAILVGESLVKQGDPAAGVRALLEL